MPVPPRVATTHADRCAVVDVALAAIGAKGPPLAGLAARMASPLRAAAEWWLLEHEGRPASSLLCYPLDFCMPDGEVVAGFGLGAVATLPECRRRGLASALCRHVADLSESKGRTVGLLYSAIAPAYYERLGYRSCAAWDHSSSRLDELAASGPRAQLVALDPRRSLDGLAALRERAHRGRLHLHRDRAAWQASIGLDPREWWLGLGDPDGELRAYARVDRDEKGLDLMELALLDPEDEAPILRALAELARELGTAELHSWIEPSPFVGEWLEDRGRARTLPMVRGCDALDGARFWGAEHF